MARGLLIGFLAGALLAGIAFKLLQRHPDGEAEGGAADKAGEKGGKVAGGANFSEAEAASRELATAKAESAKLLAEVADLKTQLAEARKIGGASKSRLSRAEKWRELASLIAQAKKDAEASGTPIKGDKYFGPLLALIGLVADDLGIPIGEATMSPDWYPMFSMSMLDASPFPMSEQQRAAFDKVMEESRKEWDAYMEGREGMSALEKAKELRELQFDMFGKLAPIGSQEQKDYMASLNLPPPNAPYQGVWNGVGPRAACKTNISNNMAKSLGFDGNQMSSLSPAIDDYMRSYDAIVKEAALKKQAGEPYDDIAAKLALSMDMQKRIGETVRMTDAQAKALKEWAQVYDYQIKE